jgi:hypothetical protein
MAGVAGLVAGSSAFAHHSPAAYDQTKEITLAGTITKVGWMNPHIYFTLAVPGPGGATVEREIQAGSASGLTALGVKKSALVVGEHITVTGFPSRRDANGVVWGVNVATAAGATFPIDFLGKAASVAPTIAVQGIAGRWLPPLRGVGLLGNLQHPLTDAGRAARADLDSYRASAATCDAWPAPMMTVVPMLRDIQVDKDAVRISFDWMKAERVVHLDRSAHPSDLQPTLQGHSIGRWEGGTLVVDTVGFAPNRSGIAVGIPSGPRKHMVERFSVAADKVHLEYQFTLEDPDYLSAPVSFTELWDHRPDLEPSGEKCDPEIARRFLEVE